MLGQEGGGPGKYASGKTDLNGWKFGDGWIQILLEMNTDTCGSEWKFTLSGTYAKCETELAKIDLGRAWIKEGFINILKETFWDLSKGFGREE